MPRTSRIVSSTSIYHVVLRGINKQIIFEEDRDYLYFISLLRIINNKYQYDIFGYCLMNNHVHLLIRASDIPLELFFKSLGVKYVFWFNAKYQRTGHLFQDRFFSSPVESEEVLFKTLQYIHHNPVKAGIVLKGEDYKWSSCAAYCYNLDDDLVSCNELLKLTGRAYYCLTSDDLEKDYIYEPADHYHVTDDDGIEIMRRVTGLVSHADFQQLPKAERDKYIRVLHEKRLSVRQLVRICGISQSTVERILKMRK